MDDYNPNLSLTKSLTTIVAMLVALVISFKYVVSYLYLQYFFKACFLIEITVYI